MQRSIFQLHKAYAPQKHSAAMFLAPGTNANRKFNFLTAPVFIKNEHFAFLSIFFFSSSQSIIDS